MSSFAITAGTIAITDASGAVWQISPSAQVEKNGVIDTRTSNVVALALVNGVLWQMNAAGWWYKLAQNNWGGKTQTSPLLATAAVAIPPAPPAAPAGATVISVDPKALTPAVGQGANWGGQNFYDSGQSNANLLFMGASFEPGYRRPLVCVVNGTATSFGDGSSGPKVPQDYWRGATYRILTGPHAGVSGLIAGSVTDPAVGTTYTLDRTLATPLTSLDRVQLDRTVLPDGNWAPGWIWGFQGSATVVTGDVPSASQGVAALKVDASSQPFSMPAYSDTSNGQRFVTHNGAYQFTVWYKVVSGSPKLSVSFGRQTSYLDTTVPLTSSSWQLLTIPFTCNETASTPPGACTFTLGVTGGVVLLDDVWLGAAQDVGFPNRKAYRDALSGMNLSDLRFWDGQGRRLADWLKPMQYRAPHTTGLGAFDGNGTSQDHNIAVESLSLPDAVMVAHQAGVPRLHLVADVGWSPDEFVSLAQWMEGDGTDAWSAHRALLGIPKLSTLFTELRISVGNETWAWGGSESDHDVWDSAGFHSPYMQRVAAITQALSLPAQYKISACVQAGDTSRPAAFAAQATEAHEYWGNGVENKGLAGSTPDAMMDAMLAEIQDRVTNTNNPWHAMHAWFAKSGQPQPYVYEFNVSPMVSQLTAGTTLPASLWAGLMDLTCVIEESKLWPIPGWMLFALPQFAQYEQGAGGAWIPLPIWGAWRGVEGNVIADRPTLLQLRLFNAAAKLGQRVATSCAVPRKSAAGASLSTFDLFTDGKGNYAAVLINLDRANSQTYSFSGVTPTGTMETLTLASANATDSNETSAVVTLRTGTQAAGAVTLPPHSAMAVMFAA